MANDKKQNGNEQAKASSVKVVNKTKAQSASENSAQNKAKNSKSSENNCK